jgi:hypothetical protein
MQEGALMDHPTYVEVPLINEVYRSEDYFFNDGRSPIDLFELSITAIQPTQILIYPYGGDHGLPVTRRIPGVVAINGTIKVPIVFSTLMVFSGEPFDIYIRDAKDNALELGILDVVFTSYGAQYVTYAARQYVQFPKPKQERVRL